MKLIFKVLLFLLSSLSFANDRANDNINVWHPISGDKAAQYVSQLPGSTSRISSAVKSSFESNLGAPYKVGNFRNSEPLSVWNKATAKLLRFCSRDNQNQCLLPANPNDEKYLTEKRYMEHARLTPQTFYGQYFLAANFVPFAFVIEDKPGYSDEIMNKALYQFTRNMQVSYTKDEVHFSNSHGEILNIRTDKRSNHVTFSEKGRNVSFSNKHNVKEVSDVSRGFSVAVLILLRMLGY